MRTTFRHAPVACSMRDCGTRGVLAISLAAISCMALAPEAMAGAAPAWEITSARAPTNFMPGDDSGRDSYLVTATNRGGAPTDGSEVTITDALAGPWLTLNEAGAASEGFSCVPGPPVSCTGTPRLAPGGHVMVEVPVDVAPGAPEELTNTVTVSGGGAPFATAHEQTDVSPAAVPFGFQSFDGTLTNADGTPDTQAGSHPYQMTTVFNLTTRPGSEGKAATTANPKDIEVRLPPGLIGDPQAVPRCTPEELQHDREGIAQGCPIGSQVGILTLRQANGKSGNSANATGAAPVYNMVPPSGMPGQLAFVVFGYPVTIDFGVRTGSDYGLTASLPDLSGELPATGSTLTIWGVPADPSHDDQRCPGPLATAECDGTLPGTQEPHPAGLPEVPFLTLPSSCEGPQTTTIGADSWQEPGSFLTDSFTTHEEVGNPIGFDGCNQLGFSPSIAVQPDTSVADSASGLQVDLSVPQSEDPTGLATPDLKTAVVTLPPGVSVDPSAADGLAACAPAQISLDTASQPACPDASKIGSVEIHTPLLPDPLLGSVYVAEQGENPFGSLLAIYLTAEADGVVIKLAGHVEADPETGQLTTTFANNPQLPFSDLKLDLFGGPRAPLATPDACGTFQTSSSLTPWSAPESGPAATPGDAFTISSGCVSGFSPAFSAGTVSDQAGAHAPFVLSFSRSDTDEDLSGLTASLPPGLLADIAGVALCPEADANAGTCPAASQVGTVQVGVGPGPQPFFLPGSIYLTGPYKGGPNGLAVVVPAVAGPYNLGVVVVRQSIHVDPSDAHVTVTSDPFPTILDGIPLRLRRVDATLDRPGFTFNPTSCAPMAIAATLTSRGGLTAPLSSRFQVANCAALPFRPSFTVATQARTSKADGASLHVRVTSGQGQANIGKVKVDLPAQLPSRLTTLQKACPDTTFDVNPASCPAASVVGTATAVTPVLNSPLAGPAYLVSHAGKAFPDLVIVLQGEGIVLDLVGNTDIKKGITSSTFKSVPDAPIDSFDLVLPEGPHSVLAAYLPSKTRGSMCGQSLSMPTAITGQNGAVIKQTTRIAVSGCPKPRKARKATKVGKAAPRGKAESRT